MSRLRKGGNDSVDTGDDITHVKEGIDILVARFHEERQSIREEQQQSKTPPRFPQIKFDIKYRGDPVGSPCPENHDLLSLAFSYWVGEQFCEGGIEIVKSTRGTRWYRIDDDYQKVGRPLKTQ